jgi:peptidyl-prolyl cis-trans isomerase SurA
MKSKLLLILLMLTALPFFAKTVDEVVVKVNDSIITKDEYEKRLSSTMEGFKREYKGPDFDQKLKEVPQKLLQQMTDELLLIEKAKQLYQVDVIVQAQVENFMKENNIKTEAELDKALKTEGMSLDEFKRQVLLIYVPEFMKSREVRSKINLTTSEIDEYYEKNKEKLQGKPQVHLEEILLPKEKYSDENAKQAYSDLLIEMAQGKTFGELAKFYSGAYSKSRNGDAGWYQPEDLASEFRDVVFGMKVGQVSNLIQTANGFYIFRLVEKKEPKVPTLEESRDMIIEMIKEDKYSESYKSYINELKKEHYVRMNPKYV